VRDDVSELLCFIAIQWSAKQRLFAIARPFLQHLVAARGVAPRALGDILPPRGGVQVNVEKPIAARAARNPPGPRHHNADLTEVARLGELVAQKEFPSTALSAVRDVLDRNGYGAPDAPDTPLVKVKKLVILIQQAPPGTPDDEPQPAPTGLPDLKNIPTVAVR
jgi:hypothetical protein